MKTYSWRVLLGKIINDPQERQRIAFQIGANHVTLTRWATNKSSPRVESLHRLLQALPRYRHQLLALIPEEFPDFFEESVAESEVVPEIPSAFYERVLQAYTATPQYMRSSSVRVTIIQQLLGHLDPMGRGIAVSISVCMPPDKNGYIRSLREDVGRGVGPWHTHLKNRPTFLGIESPQGYALAEGHLIVIHSREEKMERFPNHVVESEESAVACPILMADRVSGSVYISSPQPDYFQQPLQNLVESYTNLLVLSFEQESFYKLGQIALGMMPAYEVQQLYMYQFQQRVSQLMRIMQGTQPISRIEAEQRILQDIEEELLNSQAEE